jgi:hypothetical protein
LDLARNRKVAGFFLSEIFWYAQDRPPRMAIARIVHMLPFGFTELADILCDPRSLSSAGTRDALRYTNLPQVFMRPQGSNMLRKRVA